MDCVHALTCLVALKRICRTGTGDVASYAKNFRIKAIGLHVLVMVRNITRKLALAECRREEASKKLKQIIEITIVQN